MKSKIYNALKGVMFNYKTKDDYTSELVNIAEEFAIEFAEWCLDNYDSDDAGKFDIFYKNNMKELLEIFKKEKAEELLNVKKNGK
jgi:hypothetical protein